MYIVSLTRLLQCTCVLHASVIQSGVLLQGAERFANYKGYGQTLRYTGEHVDQSDVSISLLDTVQLETPF